MNGLKIGLLTDNYPVTPTGPADMPGGIGTYSRVVGHELARRGHTVHVFTPGPVRRPEAFDDQGVRVWQCPAWGRRREMPWMHALAFTCKFRRGGANLHRYAVLAAAQQAAREERGKAFDVIEAPDIGALGELIQREGLAKRFAMRLHCSIRDDTTEAYEKYLQRVWSGPTHEAQRLSLLDADVVTAPTVAAIEGARRIYDDPLAHAQVVGNPSAIPEQLPEPEQHDACSAVLFGRLFHQKGVDLFAKAIAPVVRELPEFRATFIGPSLSWDRRGTDAATMIRQCVRDAGVEHAVTIHPPMSHEQLMEAVRRHAIVVLPSRWETFGLTFLEAMAWQMPCVATDIPAFRELARDGDHCLFAKRENELDVARQIIRLLQDPPLRQTLATQARQHAKKWRVDRIVDQLLARWMGQAPEPEGSPACFQAVATTGR